MVDSLLLGINSSTELPKSAVALQSSSLPSPWKKPKHADGVFLFLFIHTREQVLGRVAGLVKQFVERISLQRGYSASAAKQAGGKIFTFGSYRLGVHGPGSDIDTLCVVPRHVSRDDFFETFEPMLRSFEGVTEVSVRGTLCLQG